MRYITEPVVEKAPLAVAKQDVPVVVVLPVMFGLPEHHGHTQPCVSGGRRDRAERRIQSHKGRRHDWLRIRDNENKLCLRRLRFLVNLRLSINRTAFRTAVAPVHQDLMHSIVRIVVG